jgi:hypothetical protein
MVQDMKSAPNLTLSLLRDNLVEMCDEVITHKQTYIREHREKLDERNAAIIDLMDHGYPVAALSRLTKLSRQQLYRIHSGDSGD